jgi:diguanylate cyclase (GGDEF)-like protein/PAS domain S-box-containing protein
MLATLFSAAPEAMLVADASGTIRLANRRAEELFRYAPDALVGRCVDTLVPEALAAAHARHRAGYDRDPRARPMGESLDLRGRRADGTEFPIDVALGPAEVAGERLVVAIVRDITERKLRQDELRHLSEHDALTGLLNRRGFDAQLTRACAQARRHGVPTTVLVIDLDNFKLVNDRFGHVAGDRLLCRVVQGLLKRVRAGDTIARLGGDEFAIIAPFASPGDAEGIAVELLGVVREAGRDATDGEIEITASIGVAPLGPPGRDANDAHDAADAAMYEAKRAGGDGVRVAACPNGALAARGGRGDFGRRARIHRSG